jgi:hypothetical protein
MDLPKLLPHSPPPEYIISKQGAELAAIHLMGRPETPETKPMTICGQDLVQALYTLF